MANVLEDDSTTIGECEATVVILPEDFFGNNYFEMGDWAQERGRPDHIGGTADWAKYPTRHFSPTVENIGRMVNKAKIFGVKLGRNERQEEYLGSFLDGSLAIADVGDFDASTKPVPLTALPYWLFVRSEKDLKGENVTVKTPRLKTNEDLQRLQSTSYALLGEILQRGESVGVIDRIIIKYKLDVGSEVYVPADFRADRRYQLRLGDSGLEEYNESFITSVECELNLEGADPHALERGMKQINDKLIGLSGHRTTLRFGRFSLVDNSRDYLRQDLQGSNPKLSDEQFGSLYERMQEAGRKAHEAYEKAPDSINRQVSPAKRDEMIELQRVNGRF